MEILNKSEKCANISSCKMAVFLQCIRKYDLSLTNNIINFEQRGPFTIKIKEFQHFEKKKVGFLYRTMLKAAGTKNGPHLC